MSAAFALGLGGCATSPPRSAAPVVAALPAPVAPAPVAPVKVPPPKPKPPAAPAAPNVTVLAPNNYERDRTLIKQKLAKVDADSLPAEDVGYTLDVLQGRLRQVAGPNAKVERQDERIVVDLSGHVGFDAEGVALDTVGQQVLAPIGRVLSDYRMTLVSVLVRGPSVVGKQDQRANALVRALVQAGVAARRVVVLGWGSAATTVDSAAGAALRIELQVEPIVRASAAGATPKAK